MHAAYWGLHVYGAVHEPDYLMNNWLSAIIAVCMQHVVIHGDTRVRDPSPDYSSQDSTWQPIQPFPKEYVCRSTPFDGGL